MSSVNNVQISQHLSSDTQWTAESRLDKVICEEPLEVWIQSHTATPGQNKPLAQPVLTLMRTPGDDINLVRGWLLSSGLIDSPAQIYAIHHTGSERLKRGHSNRVLVTLSAQSPIDLSSFRRHEVASSACGVCGQQSIEAILLRLEQKSQQAHLNRVPLQAKHIDALISAFSQRLPLFQQTGGNHGVALFSQHEGIIDSREDVGRHNALDKVIGANADRLFGTQQPLRPSQAVSGMGVILSGRAGFEMIQKAVMANIDYVLALGAPSSLALELAQETDMLLLGFIKPQRFNVYSGEHWLS